jgi:hypothetical protein
VLFRSAGFAPFSTNLLFSFIMYTHRFFEKAYPKGELSAFINDEELRYTTLTDEEFLALGCQGTFRYIGFYPKKRYSTHVSQSNTDFYVRHAMKFFDFEEYKKHFGFTRKGVYGKALTRLLFSAMPFVNLDEVKDKALDCFEYAKIDCIDYVFGDSRPVYPLSNWNDAVASLPTNTSAGSSFPGKKKGEVIKWAVSIADRMWHNIVHKTGPYYQRTYPPPCTLAVRGHLSPVTQNKSRCVIVYPYEVQLLEARLFKNLYVKMKAQGHLLTGRKSLRRLYGYLQDDPDLDYINLDVSGFDQMRNLELISTGFEILRSMLVLDEEEEEIFNFVRHYYIKTPILLASGHSFFQVGGVPSGTFLTLIMNTILNYIPQKTILRYLGCPVRGFHVLGDDCAFKVHTEYRFIENMFDLYCRLNMEWFGFKINTEKSVKTTLVAERGFIGYKFKNMRLHRPQEEWFRSALYPERDVKNVAVSFSRMFSYYCIGGCNDVKFNEFFEFFLTCYQHHLRKYKDKLYQRSVFRFGSLRIFKDVLDFDESDIIHLDFDGFMNKIDYSKIPLMFTLALSLRKE